MTALHQQHMLGAHHQGIHGDKHRRKRGPRPGCAVGGQGLGFFAHRSVGGGLAPGGQRLQHRLGQGCGQGGLHLLGRLLIQIPQQLTQRRGIDRALAGQFNGFPLREVAQIRTAGIFFVADQAHADPHGRHQGFHPALHFGHPLGQIVVIADGHKLHPALHAGGQAVVDHFAPLFPHPRVLGAAGLVGAAQHHNDLLGHLQRLLQQGQVPIVKRLKAANQHRSVHLIHRQTLKIRIAFSAD